MKKVILAMSGGVDSSVAAYLLKKKGYSVIGITFKFWPKAECGAHGARSCCSQASVDDARSVCAKLDIPHYVINSEELFKKEVIDYFLESYKQGLTPNPCIICNQKIKFPLLLKKAKESGFEYIATGHYARTIFDKKIRRFLIKEGKDKKKDQSYVLFSLSQDIISHLLLPIGDFAKTKIRSIAKKLNLKVHDKRESQEICFIIDNNLGRFLKQNLDKDIRPGYIKDKNGKILANHPGTCFFTTGQRRGLRVSYGKPVYVIDINPKSADIIVGDYKDTLRSNFIAKNTNWLRDITKSQGLLTVYTKMRYKDPKAKTTVKIITPETCEVVFHKPQSSPTPGQAAVFYNKDIVIGGGWIQ